MPAYRKASIRELIRSAYELDGRFIEGRLHREAEGGRWLVGDIPLDEWLSQNEGQNITLLLLSLDDERPMEERVCMTCGRKYIGVECPHCREVRTRLRGPR
ncbi:MAG TPA: hypothetical protein PKH77_25750 [Anaerolineae bacterium]|nr:hypothetical protein [Anaerolineae bacterium]